MVFEKELGKTKGKEEIVIFISVQAEAEDAPFPVRLYIKILDVEFDILLNNVDAKSKLEKLHPRLDWKEKEGLEFDTMLMGITIVIVSYWVIFVFKFEVVAKLNWEPTFIVFVEENIVFNGVGVEIVHDPESIVLSVELRVIKLI